MRGAIPPGPCLIAVKHQSMYETLEMVRLAEKTATRDDIKILARAVDASGHTRSQFGARTSSTTMIVAVAEAQSTTSARRDRSQRGVTR